MRSAIATSMQASVPGAARNACHATAEPRIVGCVNAGRQCLQIGCCLTTMQGTSDTRPYWSTAARTFSSGAGGSDGGAGRTGGSRWQGGRHTAVAAVLAGAVGVAWLKFEDQRGGLSGGPLEPLTLHVAAVRPYCVCSALHATCMPRNDSGGC